MKPITQDEKPLPQSPLPWEDLGLTFNEVEKRCNAYPKLVELLHEIGETDNISLDITNDAKLFGYRRDAMTLLKELGELE